MPICEICGMEVEKVHVCTECQSKFCKECGDVKQQLCYDCLGWTEDVEEGWDMDHLN